jgi:hypothetical protein
MGFGWKQILVLYPRSCGLRLCWENGGKKGGRQADKEQAIRAMPANAFQRKKRTAQNTSRERGREVHILILWLMLMNQSKENKPSTYISLLLLESRREVRTYYTYTRLFTLNVSKTKQDRLISIRTRPWAQLETEVLSRSSPCASVHLISAH